MQIWILHQLGNDPRGNKDGKSVSIRPDDSAKVVGVTCEPGSIGGIVASFRRLRESSRHTPLCCDYIPELVAEGQRTRDANNHRTHRTDGRKA